MAVYRVVAPVLLFPYKYLESTGEPATADTPVEDLVVDERGKPVTALGAVTSGNYVYTTKADFDAMDEEVKKRSQFCEDQPTINRFFKSSEKFQELNPKFAPLIEDANLQLPAAEAKPEPKKTSRRKSNDEE